MTEQEYKLEQERLATECKCMLIKTLGRLVGVALICATALGVAMLIA